MRKSNIKITLQKKKKGFLILVKQVYHQILLPEVSSSEFKP
jgi:hypothetical protein